MRRRRKFRIRAFSMVATILMIFSLVTPGFAEAQEIRGKTVSLNNTQNVLEAKAKYNLEEKFEEDEKVTFLIRFNEKADIKAVASKARQKAEKANLSSYNQEIQQRSAVISELKATANSSQANVREYLEEQVAKGNAEDLEFFYVVNGIKVTATKEVAEQIAKFSEVMELYPREKYQLVGELERNLSETTIFEKNLGLDKKVSNIELDNGLQSIEWNIERINAPDVWSMGFDGQGIVVANIDTGVQWDHPALKGKYAGYNSATGEVDHTYSFFDPVNGRTVPYDIDGHGSHTMGTMVGSTPDGTNQIGVAPGAKWIAVQAFSADGAYNDDLLAAAEWILAPGGDVSKAPDVVNNSWGGGPGINKWYMDAVDAWRESGIVPVFAAGNVTLANPGGPGSVASPANYPQSFAVGNTTKDNTISSSSLRGPSPYGEIKPDVSAPGTAIRSSIPGGGYASYNGTSMAAPAVAGIVALLKQANSTLKVDQIEEIIMETATPTTDAVYKESPNDGYGHGIVNAFAAVSSVAEGLGTLEGTVSMDGEDMEPPTFVHNAPKQALGETDLFLTIQVRDNVRVTDVTLNYGDTSVKAEMVSGNHKSGNFVVTVPGSVISGDSFTYNWTLDDFGGNTIITDNYTVPITEPILFEGFESDPTGWQFVTVGQGINTWEWGVPTSGPKNATRGQNVAATNLNGNYNGNEQSYFDSPAITLPEGTNFLKFDHWYDFEKNWDFGLVLATNDPEGEWTILDEITGANGGWETKVYDLSAFSGDDVYLSFSILTDSNYNYEGWYLDNITVTDVPLVVGTKGNITTATEDDITISSVPLEATVSVLESGRSTQTNPIDGSFSMLHMEGIYTVIAESYGFASKEQTVDIAADASVLANFVMEELPSRVISGTITSAKTGAAIEGATVYLVEDANVIPAETDEDGNYNITAYDGEYTVKVVAKNYHSKEVVISVDGDVTQDIQLDPFYTIPGGEIGYDDGTPENARAFYEAGNGWAVKMSLPEGADQAVVTEGVFQFHGTDWPTPGDTPFSVEVWSAGADGMPSEKLAGPVKAEAVRNLNKWTVVDLREHNIVVDGDFYLVYVQTQVNTAAPGLATDESSGSKGRSYDYVGGTFSPSPASDGNYMIRARVDIAVGKPIINGEFDNLVTKDSDVTVTGLAAKDTELNLYHNGELAGTTTVKSNGEFAVDVTLVEGENLLKAGTVIDGEVATESEEVSIVLDTEAPELSVANPVDGDMTNLDTIPVEGTVSDDHLDSLTINGEYTTVKEDGSFSTDVTLTSGENIINVVASDLAGNSTSQSVTITADFDAPVIENVQPASNLNVLPGDEVKVSFTSDTEGGIASFNVTFPGQSAQSSNPMEEVEPGVYEGTWIIPEENVDGATITVELTDAVGNTTTQAAQGVVNISIEKLIRVSGELRYDTAIEVSKEGFESADTVILSRGTEFADALAGVPLAYKLDAPILLTPSNKLWDGILEEIERLDAANVIILGGTGAVSDAVAKELKAADLNVSRIAGENRFDTAALIANEVAPNGTNQVAVTNGMDFPDALSVAAYAAKAGMPILLTYDNRLPEGTAKALTNLGVKETLVVGGFNVISEDVVTKLPKPDRIRGTDRYETNIALANYFGLNASHVYVATGQNYADALTGGVLAAKSDSAVVLVNKKVPVSVADYLQENGVKRVTIFGGEGAVSSEVENALLELLP